MQKTIRYNTQIKTSVILSTYSLFNLNDFITKKTSIFGNTIEVESIFFSILTIHNS